MARSRNIKPALFSNDELADNDPLGRLLFIGMWTIADCNGNLIWREKRIKAQILPYDNCDIKKLAINLDNSGFIRFYSDGDNLMVNIVNFSKHQNPHKNEREKGSDVPKFVDTNRESIDMATLTINRDKSGSKRNDSTSDRADSLNLIPDSPILIPDSIPSIEIEFERFWLAGMTKQSKQNAKKAFAKQFKEAVKVDSTVTETTFTDYLVDDIQKRLQAQVFGFDKMHPTTYLNQQRWNDEIVSQVRGGNLFQSIDTLQDMQLAPQQPEGLLNHGQ